MCSKLTGEPPCRSLISIRFQSNFTEITLRHGWSPINLLHIFRTPFTKNASEWLLYIYVHLRKSIWTVVWWKQSFLYWLLRSCRYLLVTKICFSNSAPISFRKLLLHSFILKLYIHCFKKSLQFWRNAMRFILKAKNLFLFWLSIRYIWMKVNLRHSLENSFHN